MNDVTLVKNGNWYELFKKYELYLYKKLARQDVEEDDRIGEAWLLIEGVKENLDLSKVTNPENWNVKPLLDYQLNNRYRKNIARTTTKRIKVLSVEPTVIDETTPARNYSAYDKLVLVELLEKTERRFSRKHSFVLEQLTKGYNCTEISRALGVTKQLVSRITKEIKPLVASYL